MAKKPKKSAAKKTVKKKAALNEKKPISGLNFIDMVVKPKREKASIDHAEAISRHVTESRKLKHAFVFIDKHLDLTDKELKKLPLHIQINIAEAKKKKSKKK
jgi:hypothetical protein